MFFHVEDRSKADASFRRYAYEPFSCLAAAAPERTLRPLLPSLCTSCCTYHPRHLSPLKCVPSHGMEVIETYKVNAMDESIRAVEIQETTSVKNRNDSIDEFIIKSGDVPTSSSTTIIITKATGMVDQNAATAKHSMVDQTPMLKNRKDSPDGSMTSTTKNTQDSIDGPVTSAVDRTSVTENRKESIDGSVSHLVDQTSAPKNRKDSIDMPITDALKIRKDSIDGLLTSVITNGKNPIDVPKTGMIKNATTLQHAEDAQLQHLVITKHRKQSIDESITGMLRMRHDSVDESTTGFGLLKGDGDHLLGLADTPCSAKSNNDNSVASATSGYSLPAHLHMPLVSGVCALDHLDALGGCHSDDAASLIMKNAENFETKDALGGFDDDSVNVDSKQTEGSEGTDDEHNLQRKVPAATTEYDDDGDGVGDECGETITSGNQRLLIEALMVSDRGRRERLESWGGMSDISGIGEPSIGLGEGAALLAASALHETGIFEDVTAAVAAMNAPGNGDDSKASMLRGDSGRRIPSKIALTRQRKSVASLSGGSEDEHSKPKKEIGPDLQAFVVATMKSVEGKLAEIAKGETVTSSAVGLHSENILEEQTKRARTESLGSVELNNFDHHESPMLSSLPSLPSSISDFHIQAAMDVQAAHDLKAQEEPHTDRLRSLSTLSAFSATGLSLGLSEPQPIAVDYDAVAAAVSAANLAVDTLDMTAIAGMTPPSGKKGASSLSNHAMTKPDPILSDGSGAYPSTPSSKLASTAPPDLPPIPKSTMSEQAMEAIRARARAAAGYVPPSVLPATKRPRSDSTSSYSSRAPIKKRLKRPTPETARSSSTMTPYMVASSIPGRLPYTPKPPLGKPGIDYATPSRVISMSRNPSYLAATPTSAMSSASRGGQSSQKWDDMFDCLVKFIETRKKKEYKGTENGKFEWDGNVPTTYKTPDGKALGRWINNQRSAKHKGVLKVERENRLVGTGLKWSVLSTNSWTDMMEELRIYVKEKTKEGEKWDGNVPTNYRIKGNTDADGEEIDEEKNLGRWINRQRSLFQAGKLKKERQLELEKIGLKWSVLSTTSWHAMYDALCDYVRDRKITDPLTKWDGNVPANHKTTDSPPKSLGRWVNRQRSAYSKNKLKSEFVDKLNRIGLKWAVHERRPLSGKPEDDGNGDDLTASFPPSPDVVVSNRVSVPPATKFA